MTQDTILKDFIEKESGLTVKGFIEDKRYTEMSFMRQKITLEGTTFVFRCTHLMDGRLDVHYFRKDNHESKCNI